MLLFSIGDDVGRQMLTEMRETNLALKEVRDLLKQQVREKAVQLSLTLPEGPGRQLPHRLTCRTGRSKWYSHPMEG